MTYARHPYDTEYDAEARDLRAAHQPQPWDEITGTRCPRCRQVLDAAEAADCRDSQCAMKDVCDE